MTRFPFAYVRRFRWLVFTAVGLVGAGVAWRWNAGWPRPGPASAGAPDPRLTYPTPFKNVRPEVKYVGDQVCGECHHDHAKHYAHHPMGQALAPTPAATPIERYEAAVRNPFAVGPLNYAVRRRDGKVFHREWAAGPGGKVLVEIEVEAQFAIGSGAKARSYGVSRDGYLFESPITWYPHGNRWDLSPSYEIRNQHFSRAIAPGCLFCHCNQADHVPDTVNRYREPIFQGFVIGCERCHGPGELHVRRREAGEKVAGLDDTIVNPARLEHALREAVCQQCHVQGEQRVVARGRGDFDYRPGLPLHLFLMDFVDGKETRDELKFVSSVEQMMASKCYAGSREPKKLGCISCHDPHRHPAGAEKVTHYRDRCLRCHTDTSCSLEPTVRRAKHADDSCIACHMPPTGSEVNHSSITDHRILRRPSGAAPVRRPTPGPMDLVPFHRPQIAADDPEVERNLGLARMMMLDRGPPEAAAREYAAAALPLLERAVERDPRDFPAARSRADALWALGRADEALPLYEALLAERPESEITLRGAGNLALALNRPDEALTYFERAVRVNPWRHDYHHGLAVAAFRLGQLDRAEGACRQSLRLEPTNAASRSLLVQCYLSLGRKDRAAAEYETLRHLTAENRRGELQRWYDEQRRRLGGS